jgi:hypothetical protein
LASHHQPLEEELPQSRNIILLILREIHPQTIKTLHLDSRQLTHLVEVEAEAEDKEVEIGMPN